jgi:hypothetical protein
MTARIVPTELRPPNQPWVHYMKILIARMSPFGDTAIFELRRLGHPPSEIQETGVPLLVFPETIHFFGICLAFPAIVWNRACYHQGATRALIAI